LEGVRILKACPLKLLTAAFLKEGNGELAVVFAKGRIRTFVIIDKRPSVMIYVT
jgi:hypothetical protein